MPETAYTYATHVVHPFFTSFEEHRGTCLLISYLNDKLYNNHLSEIVETDYVHVRV